MTPPVLRFAPSPNGRLHLGHALSVLTGEAWVRRLGGRFLLRIEDIDTARARPEFVAGIFEDLAWLGIAWETTVLRQSEHFPIYGAAAQRLTDLGLLYPCFATRTEIAAAAMPGLIDPDGAPLYPGLHKDMTGEEAAARRARGERPCLRLDMARAQEAARAKRGGDALTFNAMSDDGTITRVAADPARWGDAIIVRKDTPTSYHLAVVVDDARQGITHVTRGIDLFAATDLHRLLQVLLDLPEPIYAHHTLIMGPDGRKLSKSAGDTSLAQLRARGIAGDDIRRQLGFPASG
jgi:glutamyl-Q tRNA(Asp) synthetase